jgi:hypothetical protein
MNVGTAARPQPTVQDQLGISNKHESRCKTAMNKRILNRPVMSVLGCLSFGAPTPVKYSVILITTPFEEVLEQCANVGVIWLSIEGESPSVKEKNTELVRNAGT